MNERTPLRLSAVRVALLTALLCTVVLPTAPAMAQGTIPQPRIETIDVGRDIVPPSDHFMRLDANDNPHLAYGGNHLFYSFLDGGVWHVEVADWAPDVGGYASLALDAAGNPIISYFDRANHDLKLARRTGGRWNTETVDAEGETGGYTSLALDSAGNPHIAYCRFVDGTSTCQALRYARHDGVRWHLVTVDQGGAGRFSSLALDECDLAHISYYRATDGTNGELRYAQENGSGWAVQTVDAAGNVGEYSSLALDSAGRPHISYYDRTNADLKYAHWSGNAWNTQVLQSEGDVGRGSSIAVDAADRPHVSYAGSGTDASVRYTYWTGSGWADEWIDRSPTVASPPEQYQTLTSLALDANCRPRVGIKNGMDPQFIRYAARSRDGWQISVVDHPGGPFTGSSLAFDPRGRLTICYRQGALLRYARQGPAGWDIQTVDADPMLVVECQQAIDGAGNAHIVYTAGIFTKVKYARWTGSAWATETLDSVLDWRHAPSIALDPAGQPQIVYIDPAGNLRYLRRTGDGWINETIDGPGRNGTTGHPSLVVDQAGRAFVSYYGQNGTALMYGRQSGDQWQLEVAGPAGSELGYTALMVQGADDAQIAYFDTVGASTTLRYAARTNQGWTILAVGPGQEHVAMICGGNKAVLAYDGVTTDVGGLLRYDGLQLARGTDGAFHTMTFDPGGHAPSLARGQDGGVAMAFPRYLGLRQPELRLATGLETLWSAGPGSPLGAGPAALSSPASLAEDPCNCGDPGTAPGSFKQLEFRVWLPYLGR